MNATIHLELERLALDGQLAICDPVVMEILAGARDRSHRQALHRSMALATLVPTSSLDYVQAADLYRACRRNGETVRKMLDCLIAAVAIAHDLPVLHADADFETLGRHTTMQSHE